MNQSGRLIIEGSPETTAEKVSAPILPQVLQTLSKSEDGVYSDPEEAGPVPCAKRRDKPRMAVRPARGGGIIAEFSAPILLLSAYPALPAGDSQLCSDDLGRLLTVTEKETKR
jgi:hypothetical protein